MWSLALTSFYIHKNILFTNIWRNGIWANVSIMKDLVLCRSWKYNRITLTNTCGYHRAHYQYNVLVWQHITSDTLLYAGFDKYCTLMHITTINELKNYWLLTHKSFVHYQKCILMQVWARSSHPNLKPLYLLKAYFFIPAKHCYR